jgi:protein-S-isoprenylcysteine O-methyltransferase Ste14
VPTHCAVGCFCGLLDERRLKQNRKKVHMGGDAWMLLQTMLGAMVLLILIGLGYTMWKATGRQRIQMLLGLLGMLLSLGGVVLVAWRQRSMGENGDDKI